MSPAGSPLPEHRRGSDRHDDDDDKRRSNPSPSSISITPPPERPKATKARREASRSKERVRTAEPGEGRGDRRKGVRKENDHRRSAETRRSKARHSTFKSPSPRRDRSARRHRVEKVSLALHRAEHIYPALCNHLLFEVHNAHRSLNEWERLKNLQTMACFTYRGKHMSFIDQKMTEIKFTQTQKSS